MKEPTVNPAPAQPAPVSATTVTPDPSGQPAYDSNPFTLSFRGFGMLVDHAKGVVILLAVFGFLNFIGGQFNSGSDYNFESDSNISSSEILEDGTLASVDDFEITLVGVATGLSVAMILILGVVLIGALFITVVGGAVAAAAVSSVNKKDMSIGQAFSAMGSRFGVLYHSTVISGFKVLGGLLLFIVPGIRAGLRYSAVPYIAMAETDLDAHAVLARSKSLYNKHLMEVFGIGFVGGLVPIIGESVKAAGMASSHQQLAAYAEAKLQTPKTHWANYVVVGVVIFMTIAMLLIFSLFVAWGAGHGAGGF